MSMPVLQQETYFEFLKRVEHLRYHLAKVKERQNSAVKKAESVLKMFGVKLEDTTVPRAMEQMFANKRERMTSMLAKDPRHLSSSVVMDVFWSPFLFPVRSKLAQSRLSRSQLFLTRVLGQQLINRFPPAGCTNGPKSKGYGPRSVAGHQQGTGPTSVIQCCRTGDYPETRVEHLNQGGVSVHRA